MRIITLSIALLAAITSFGQAQIDLPITWEGTTTNYGVTDFGGNASSLVADPTNASNMVLKSDKTANAELWAGTTFGTGTAASLATAIPFAVGSTVMTVKVYSPDAGIQVRLKAEDAADPTKSVETEATTTVANQWETLTFDFANQASGTAAINFAFTYNKLSIFYNFGVTGAIAGLKTYYCDDVQFGGTSNVKNVTFRVDMVDYSGTFTTPEVNGVFNNWCGNCAAMTDADNDGIWEITIPITTDSIEYKFSYDNWGGQENMTQGAPCTKTTGTFTNRVAAISSDTTLPAVCFSSCDPCARVGLDENILVQGLKVYPNPASTSLNVSGMMTQLDNYLVNISDISGKVLISKSIKASEINENFDVSALKNGIYFISVENGASRSTEKFFIQR